MIMQIANWLGQALINQHVYTATFGKGFFVGQNKGNPAFIQRRKL